MTTVFFDLETDSIREDCQIIQLAALAVDHTGKELAEFERKLQFDLTKAEPEALQLNSYDEETWAKHAVNPLDALSDFERFLKPHADVQMISKRTGRPYNVARLAGYNAASFDGPRLQRAFQNYGKFLPAHPQVMCVLNLALWAFHGKSERPKSMKLGDVCEFFGVPIDAHDALHDVRATVALVEKLRAAAGVAA